jgi:Zn-dependent M32 family carboxypeptidase
LPVKDLIVEATGKPLTAAAYLRYLESKYLEAP